MALNAYTNDSCCAILEVAGLAHAPTPVEALRQIAYNVGEQPFILFTGVSLRVTEDHTSNRADDYAQALADLIERENLGPVTRVGPRVNPASKNEVKVFVWEPNYTCFFDFVADHGGTIEPGYN